MKWLDFGSSRDEGSVSPDPGFVWIQAGYTEAIPWRKVRPTKQRNVAGLAKWQKLKKYVPNNKHGDACPNGVPTVREKGDTDDND